MHELFTQDFYSAVIGGSLIGIAVSLLLAFNGRVAGLSGIIAGGVFADRKREGWRWFFLIGLLLGGALVLKIDHQRFLVSLNIPDSTLILSGILVGFGTRLGGGCTSGHGICGVSRFSRRSIIATCLFIATGMITATFIRKYFV